MGRALAKGLGRPAIGQKRDADVAAARAGRLCRAPQRFGQPGGFRDGGGDDGKTDEIAQRSELRVRAHRRIDDAARVFVRARDDEIGRERAERAQTLAARRRILRRRRLMPP